MNKWTLKKKFSLKHSTISNLLESWKTRRERKIESEPNHQPVFFMSEWCSHTQAKKFANLGEKRFLANHWAKNYDKNKEFINWWGDFFPFFFFFFFFFLSSNWKNMLKIFSPCDCNWLQLKIWRQKTWRKSGFESYWREFSFCFCPISSLPCLRIGNRNTKLTLISSDNTSVLITVALF